MIPKPLQSAGAAVLWVAALAVPAHAALVIDYRQTLLQATTQWGFVGGVVTEQHEFRTTSLTDDLQARLGNHRQGEGALGDGSWIANFDFQFDQQIEFQPDRAFNAAGTVNLFAFVGDQGVAVVDARPANRLELGFTVTLPEVYTVSGAASGFASVSLERKVGGETWEPLAGSSSEIFLVNLALEPGRYRVMAEGSGLHDGSTGIGSAWTISVTPVPEPSVWALALAGTGAMATLGGRRIRRRS